MVCRALLRDTLIGRRLAALAGLPDLDACQQARLSVLACLHDLGKCNRGFQYRYDPDRPVRLAGHIREALVPILHRTLRTRTRGVLAEVLAWGDDVLPLLLAALSHHGIPLVVKSSAAGLDRDLELWQADARLDPIGAIADIVAVARGAFPEAFVAGGRPLPECPPFQHAFTGVVALADWIASDAALFPYAEEGRQDRAGFAAAKASEALRAIGMDVGAARMSLAAAPPSFEEWAGFAPNPMQREVARIPLGPGSVAVLESETGSGKTEAAIAHFLRLFAAGTVDGLYFALPTRAAAVQIHARVHCALVRALGSDAAPPVVMAVPGYLRVDDAEGVRPLSDDPFRVRWDGGVAEGRGWAAENPRRYTAASVAVGTVDQALMPVLQVKHAHLRACGLSRSLVVVDEVHASDPYMERLLTALVDAHQAAGGQVLLMSATLGSRARARYVAESRRGPALSEARKDPYPAIWRRGAGPVALAGGADKPVAVACAAIIDRPDSIAEMAADAARRGARTLVIRNTVADALAAQAALETAAGGAPLFAHAGRLAPHHARFAREDRQSLDEALERAFGREHYDPVVAVATQTAEQSLDIDADLLITDLCPMDVLLQRIGRLHRHRRARPAGFENARCVLLVPEGRDLAPLIARSRHGLGNVYPDLRVIEATWRAAERCGTFAIPAMNRVLVEEATHSESLAAIVAELGAPWAEHAGKMEGIRAGKEAVARMNLIDRTLAFGNFDFAALKDHVKTRLGMDDRAIFFPDGWRGPFGQPVGGIVVPGFLAPAGECEPTFGRDGETTLIALGDEALRYDRWGLRPAGSPAAP